MKLSVDLYALSKRFGDFKAAELVKEAGFDAIDYPFFWDYESDEILGDSYKEHAQKFRRHLDEIGLECNQAHSLSLRYGATFDITDPKYLWVVHSLESAAILGAQNIVVHAISVPRGVDLEEYNIRYYTSLIPYCEKFGIHVAVENLFGYDQKRKHVTSKLGSPEDLNSIVEKINSPWIVACVDIGHAALTGFEPDQFISELNPSILKSLHVHDNNYVDDSHVLPYTSELNWKAIMRSLKDIGYRGDITFEILHFLKKFPDELIPDALKMAAAVGRYFISLIQ